MNWFMYWEDCLSFFVTLGGSVSKVSYSFFFLDMLHVCILSGWV